MTSDPIDKRQISMDGRWTISSTVSALRPGEDEYLTMIYKGEVVVQDEFETRIPLHVEVRDSEHDWFSVHLLVRWARHERRTDDDSVFVLLTIREMSLIPDHPEYPVPTEILGDPVWWKSVLDKAEEHLFGTAGEFDPGFSTDGPPQYGWESGPITPPLHGELIDRRPLDTD